MYTVRERKIQIERMSESGIYTQIERERYRVTETEIEQISESGICTDEKE